MKKILVCLGMVGMALSGLAAKAAHAGSWRLVSSRVIRSVKRMPTPTTIKLKSPCNNRRFVHIHTRNSLVYKTRYYCNRFRNHKPVTPTYRVLKYSNVQVGSRTECHIRLQILRGGSCVDEYLRVTGLANGATFGMARGTVANTDAYCRNYRLMTVMRRVAARQSRRAVLAHCRSKGFPTLRYHMIGGFTKVKNYSKLRDRYICGATFRISHYCAKAQGPH